HNYEEIEYNEDEKMEYSDEEIADDSQDESELDSNAFYCFCDWVREERSMLPSPHENAIHLPINKLSAKMVNKVKSFIRLTGEQHREGKYTRKKIDRSITVQYEKHDIDVCDKCTLFKCALKENNNINEDLDNQFAIHMHNYHAMREIYESDIQIAKAAYNPQQLGRWYYSSLLKVHQFGLVDEGIDHHWHALYTEAKASKRANEVTSIVHLFLTSVAALSLLYCKPLTIQKYHCFQFSSENPGTMKAKVKLTDLWNEFLLLKQNVDVESLNPQELLQKGFPEEKLPSNDLIERVGKQKRDHAKEAQQKQNVKKKK
ncbi:13059_t:CDS:2, partial [Racocetra fulgida]